MKKPRVSIKRLTKKMWKPMELPKPTQSEVKAAEKRGSDIEDKIHKTNKILGWW